MLHVRIADQTSAERFIDALQTMREFAVAAPQPS